MSLSDLEYLLNRIQSDVSVALEKIAKLQGPQTVAELRVQHPSWLFLDSAFQTLQGWERSGIVAKLTADKHPFGSEYVLQQGYAPIYDFDLMLTHVEFDLGIQRAATEAPADE